MKRTVLLIGALALLLTVSSCEKSKIKKLDNIGYGTSFGMCDGYCLNTLLVSYEKVSFSKTNRLLSNTKTCTKVLTEAEVDAIKKLLDKSVLAALPKTIGCPDCADGGAEWLSLTADGKQYKVTFEYGHAPKELKAAVDKLKALKETFDNCN